jgi:hypothetical protein
MPIHLGRLLGGIAVTALLLASSIAQAEALRPNDDSLVLAKAVPQSAGQAGAASLAYDSSNLDLALGVARSAIEQGRATSDPRAYGEAEAALSHWWNEAEPPQQVRLLRAVIRQANHEFPAAAADLDAVLDQAPRDAQARLSRAFLRMVTGDIDGAMGDCSALPYGARGLIRNICFARAAALSGQAAKGRLVLQRVLGADNQSTPAMRKFATAVLADLNAGLGRTAEAEALYAATAAEPDADVSLLAAYADLLLDMNRDADALRLLDGRGEQDALLLRRAIAAKRLDDRRLGEWSTILNERFSAALAAGNRVHLREEALFRLKVEDNPAAALPLAVQNWSVQKEPADARLLIEAALAARDTEAAQPVADFIARTKLDDQRLMPLVARLESK